jgi:Na+/H+ antiporter NhaC
VSSEKIIGQMGVSFMGWLTILPPIIAIAVVLWRKEVILALLIALLSAEILIGMQGGFQISELGYGFINTTERIAATLADLGNSRILIFCLLVGTLIAFMQYSGGVSATVQMLIDKGISKTGRSAGVITSLIGVVIFIETNLSILTSGIFARGLFDKFHMSRVRLAYIIDSTSAPISILILFNGWGAFIYGLLKTYDIENPMLLMMGTIPFNFYAIITLVIVAYTVWTGNVFGPMKKFEKNQEILEARSLEARSLEENIAPTKARFMIVPLAAMILSVFGFMLWTGNGDMTAGSGSQSVLYATVLACIIGYMMLLFYKRFDHDQMLELSFKGMNELLPVVIILLLSMTLGNSLKLLGTGVFVAGLVSDNIPLIFIVPLLFITSSLMAFSTGTSWGTFGIMIPIGVPLFQQLGLPPELVISAVLGGGVFGDHCSPISDTSVVSAMASGCTLIDHVKTQIPYSLFGGAVTVVLYIIASVILI